MWVALEVLDRAGARVPARAGGQRRRAAAPAGGERVTIEAPGGTGPPATWRVTERDCTYVAGDAPLPLVGGGTRQTPVVTIRVRGAPVP